MRSVEPQNSLIRRLVSDKRGNFGIMAALLVPVMLTAVAVTMDISKLLADKTKLASALDAASLATASALSNGDIKLADAQTFAARITAGQLASVLSAEQVTEIKSTLAAAVSTSGSGSATAYTVKVTARFSDPLLGFSAFHPGGVQTVGGASTSTSQSESTNALSLYLVLDKSGSMSWPTTTLDNSHPHGCIQYYEQYWPYGYYFWPCYINKMGSLKAAASKLFDEMDKIESADPTNTVVRTAAVSFDSRTQSASDLAWGTKNARSYVNKLPDNPTGGTNMSGGVATAANALKDPSEAKAQATKGNTTFQKFMVLMTDGENTDDWGNPSPQLDAATLANCETARANGVTIFTVAYMAPARGEALLKACSGDLSNFYKANDMPSLIKAFSDIGEKVSKQTTRMTS